MKKYLKKAIVLAGAITYVSAFSLGNVDLNNKGENTYIPSYNSFFSNNNDIQVINTKQMQVIKQASMNSLTSYWQYKAKPKNENQLVSAEVAYFNKLKIPYGGGIGEGWDNPLNIQQDLTFRLDEVNCVTVVQDIMGIILAEEHENVYNFFFEAFKKGLYSVSYGAFPSSLGKTYENRNNFVSSDFNKVNNKLGYIQDVTADLGLKYNRFPAGAKNKTINHSGWFNKQKNNLSNIHIADINLSNKQAIVDKFTSKEYGANFPNESVSMNYIPKDLFYTKQGDDYYANTNNIKKLMADNIPKIVEFVRDDSKWIIAGKPISTLIGSDILVSHLGILYNATFNKGDVIYNQINCAEDDGMKVCKVIPVKCSENTCKKVMLFMASNAYPNSYVLSKNNSNKIACTDPTKVPSGYTIERNVITNNDLTCNRAFSMPFGDYFIHKMYNKYPYIDSQSILGINLQKITMFNA
ncbi:N-acetylmuramoyl-L-alanine amidase-like domain-containing protein [Francisella sp. 19X1-34]|uniref:N-acetylmuramoyl-L-alanine amidase-like domain-containing protein n=1 Tax=Francisella sp. 19X1-34 TaxID=3087177 RepID=UPI002E330515|nr:N-acetylmuramoyl-L-alanine amidase-like domain-containing protein [Francisella sp. 19X1-34]MED7789687.1 DUF1460 domain-containing protein [Francisella sp. 19X1-34]